MGLVFRISNIDLPCKSFDINYAQNSVSQFTAVVPRAYIAGLTDLYFKDASIIKDGVTLISGIAYDEDIDSIDDNGTIFSKVFCYDEMGRLLNDGPLVNPENAAIGHFQDKELLGIVMLLLTGTTSFKIGNFSTMINPLIKITVDLRNVETRWAQIIQAVSKVENCFVRYGGFDFAASRHTLDIGAFGSKFVVQNEQSNYKIFRIERVKSRFERIREYIATGGNLNTAPNRPLTLNDALTYDPTLATHATYPIVTLASTAKAVRNNTVSIGATRKKEFSDIKTRNDAAPSGAEIAQAGYALWQAVVSEMQKQKNNVSYNVEAFFSSVPKLGDTINVVGSAYQTVINPVTYQTEEVSTFSVNGDFYIHKMDFDYNNEIEKIKLLVGTSRYANDGDNELDLYETLDTVDNIGVAVAAVTFSIALGSQAQSGVAANCLQYVVNVGQINGRSFSVALPVPPVGATAVTFAIASSIVGATITTTQVPALPATGWAGCVSVNNNWTVSDSVTITIVFVFT